MFCAFSRLFNVQIEVERSLYSDHELRALDEAQRLARRKADAYDEDDDEQNILLVQDLEDMWEQKFLQFKPGARVTGSWSFSAGRRNGEGSVLVPRPRPAAQPCLGF